MFVALDKDQKRIYADEAVKGEIYYCPICGKQVLLKEGKIRAIHFYHESAECEDKWHYDMSEWHYGMQERFPKKQREVVVRHNGEVHRADILLGNRIIEFQHSPISAEEIEKRNKFYRAAGYSVAWVFDISEQYNNGQIEYLDRGIIAWKHAKSSLQVFPKIKEYDKSIMVYLFWEEYEKNNNGTLGELKELFSRVIWTSSNELGRPDFRRVLTDAWNTTEMGCSLDISWFFRTKDDELKEHLAKLGCKYKVKYKGIKGKNQEDYVCPRTQKFGLKIKGDSSCRYCKYCGVIRQIGREYYNIYCCYPNQVNEVDEVQPEYESSGVKWI